MMTRFVSCGSLQKKKVRVDLDWHSTLTEPNAPPHPPPPQIHLIHQAQSGQESDSQEGKDTSRGTLG